MSNFNKQVNLATTTNISTTYAGEFAGKYLAAALLSGKTLDNGYITVRPNIKYKEVLKKYSNDDIVFDASCDFNPTSTITLTENILQPKELQVNLELCKKDFRSDWEAIQMGMSAFDNLPPTFADFMIGQIAAQVAEKVEKNIWTGSSAISGQFASFDQLFRAGGSGVIQPSLVGTSITGSSTVVAGLQKIVDAVPDTIYGKEDAGIYVSTATMKAYQLAVSANYAGGYDMKNVVGLKPMDYQGIPLWHCPGLKPNAAVFAQKSNLHFGTGLMNDMNEVKVIDMADIDGSQNVRVVMRYTAGVNFAFGPEIVYGLG
jgi:hypothetical protein